MIILLVSTIPIVGFNQNASAVTLLGPLPYLSGDDSPFFGADGPGADLCSIEDFEDGSLDFGITASTGGVVGPSTPVIDSVDGDDGSIDGLGNDGHSWFTGSQPAAVTFTFPSAVTHAGIVWTDGVGTNPTLGPADTTFEAFGPGMVSLGTVGPLVIGDMMFNGATAEDRFFGAIEATGISAISVSVSVGNLEVDHVQFCTQPKHVVGGELIPLDSIMILLAGTQMTAAWVIPMVVSAVGIGIVIARKF